MITINPQAADVITIQLSDADQIALNTAAILLEDRDADTLQGEDGAYYLDRDNHTGTQAANTITGLATVATSGSYNDLSNKPTISTNAETLDGQDGAYYLSRANHTGSDQISDVTGLQAALDLKLNIADYNDRFLGLFSSVFDLVAAHPTASAGDYAQVDLGIGSDVIIYAWDVSDAKWAAVGSSAIANTDALPEGSSNLYFTSQRVRDTPLTGLSTATAAPITAADTVLVAAGKLQRQATDNAALLPQPFGTAWYKTGLYYDAVYPYYTTFAPTTGAAGILYLCKRKILDDVTFNELSVNVTTAAAGGVVFYGIYASDTSGLPSTLLASGSSSSATTGVKSTTVTLALTKGQVVWDACLFTGASVAVTGFQPIFQDGTNSPVANGVVVLVRSSQTSLPADASVGGSFVRSTTPRIPRVALRAA